MWFRVLARSRWSIPWASGRSLVKCLLRCELGSGSSQGTVRHPKTSNSSAHYMPPLREWTLMISWLSDLQLSPTLDRNLMDPWGSPITTLVPRSCPRKGICRTSGEPQSSQWPPTWDLVLSGPCPGPYSELLPQVQAPVPFLQAWLQRIVALQGSWQPYETAQ